jgi:catechol 2,3-dioxygenase-like lactoylglutathione lyase family enzyme
MITGAHVVVYSKDPEADRAFFRDLLKFSAVDAGHGWLIFALPPAEAAFHSSEQNDRHELYFMCDNLKATMEELKQKNVVCGAIKEERWGSLTTVALPGGGKIGLYQPKHAIAIRQS